MTRRYVDTADCAKLIRKALKARWPGTKFSVRTRRYSGGSSIDVAWTDGPAEHDVEPVGQRFRGATFDGMTDCMNYHEDLVSNQDGSVEAVHYGADFVFCRRDFSPEFEARADEQCAAFYGREWWSQYDDRTFPGRCTTLRVWCCGSNEDGTSVTKSDTSSDRRIYADALEARWRWQREQDATAAVEVDPWSAFIEREGVSS